MEKIKLIGENLEGSRINHLTQVDGVVSLLIGYDPEVTMPKKEGVEPFEIFIRICGKISTLNPIITSEIIICYNFEMMKRLNSFEKGEVVEMFQMATKNFIRYFDLNKIGTVLKNVVAKENTDSMQKAIDIIFETIS